MKIFLSTLLVVLLLGCTPPRGTLGTQIPNVPDNSNNYECLFDNNCVTGKICEDKECITGCRVDNDCSANQICSNLECIEDTALTKTIKEIKNSGTSLINILVEVKSVLFQGHFGNGCPPMSIIDASLKGDGSEFWAIADSGGCIYVKGAHPVSGLNNDCPLMSNPPQIRLDIKGHVQSYFPYNATDIYYYLEIHSGSLAN